MQTLRRRSALLLLAFLAAPAALAAQRATIVGLVIEAGSRQPIPNAQLQITGTQLGGATNDRGRYLIPNLTPGTITIRVTRIGFSPQSRTITAAAGDTVHADFQLTIATVQLDQVVVTGTAGTQVRRAQAAVIADIDAADVVKTAPVTSVAEVLQSRVPGVSVQRNDGTSGTGQTIRIRGASSINLSNEPLIFIDGIRADSRSSSPGNNRGGGCSGCDIGGQATSRLNDIPPEDIESIEVVKGPAAATLYGSDASAGVIQIITKRGKMNSGALEQSISTEFNTIDPNWTPPSNYAACTATNVADATSTLCFQKPVGTIVTDNPLVRDHVLNNGSRSAVNWSGRGGGPTFGYYTSASYDHEGGTLPSNSVLRKSGRINFHFQPLSTVIVDAGYGVLWDDTQLPDQGNDPYAFEAALISSPVTLGGVNNGWQSPFRNAAAIAAIDSRVNVVRNTPTIDIKWAPFARFTNSLTVGGDLSSQSTSRLVPRSDIGAYSANDNVGHVLENRQSYNQYTLSYLGNVKTSFLNLKDWESDVSFGSQIVDQELSTVTAEGFGLASNTARAVSAAATQSGTENTSTARQVGFYGQLQLSHANRLFLQAGARVDQATGFGENVKHFFLPTVGASYVISEEPFFRDHMGAISQLRLRAKYGTTGRAPPIGAAQATYAPCSYLDAGVIRQGVCLSNPGNPNLKPEKGTEFETGFDMGVLHDRVGLEVTYFRKVTKDLLLTETLPPSLGFAQNRQSNIGSVLNDGVEVSLHTQLVDTRHFGWDMRIATNTLRNKVLDLGNLPLTPGGNQPGFPLSPWTGWKVHSIDAARGIAILGDSIEYLGNKLPRWEGSFFNGFNFGSAIRLSAQLDWKAGYFVNNNTASFREKSTPVAQNRVDTTALSLAERIARFGPYRTATKDSVVTSGSVTSPYIQDGKFLRLRELSLSIQIPDRYLVRSGVHGATVTFAGRNLSLWKGAYEGPDPEVHSNAFNGTDQADFLQLPQARRYVVRFAFQP
jgi:TonB-linked SusC/RagA family outer membrane protein